MAVAFYFASDRAASARQQLAPAAPFLDVIDEIFSCQDHLRLGPISQLFSQARACLWRHSGCVGCAAGPGAAAPCRSKDAPKSVSRCR